MPRYIWNVEFEAENDEEAKRVIYDEAFGAIQGFESVHDESLTNEQGEPVR